MKVQDLVNSGHSLNDARNILFNLGNPSNLEQGKMVIRRWSGERKNGGQIVSAGIRYLGVKR